MRLLCLASLALALAACAGPPQPLVGATNTPPPPITGTVVVQPQP